MASDASRDTYQALLIGDPRLRDSSCLWSAQSSYTQAGPRPGVPVAQNDSEMVLQASGSQVAGSAIRVRAARAGMPEPGGGAFVWRNSTDDTDEYRGWDPPSLLAGWEAVEWTDGASPYTVREVGQSHAVTLSDGTVLVTAQVRHVFGATTYRVYVWTRDPDDGTWSSQSVYSQSSAPTFGLYPCLLVLPSGRIHLYHYVEDAVNNLVQVRLHYSDDSGMTWTEGSASVLDTPFDTSSSPGSAAEGGDPGRFRVAHLNGQVLLVAEYKQHDTDAVDRDVIQQHASSDLGCRFAHVETWDGTTATGQRGGKYLDLIVIDGKFCFYLVETFGGSQPVQRRIASAYSPLSDATREDTVTEGTWAVNDGGTGGADFEITDGDLTAYVDDDGSAYLILRWTQGADEIVVARSNDGGDTWELLGRAGLAIDMGLIYDSGDTGTYPVRLAATAQGGRGLLMHGWEANPGDEEDSLGVMYLGGYSAATMPSMAVSRTDVWQMSWTTTWLPFDEPGDSAWTVGGTGGSDTLTAGYLEVTTSAASRWYEVTPTIDVSNGIIVRISMDLAETGGTDLGSPFAGVQVRVADGATEYHFSVALDWSGTNAQYAVYDELATAVGDDHVVGTAGTVDLLIFFRDGKISTFHRERSNQSDRAYVPGVTNESLTADTGSPAASSFVQWGHCVSGTNTTRWYEVSYRVWPSDETAAQDHADGLTNPGDLFPRTFSVRPTYVDAGVKVRALDGPCVASETWHVDARYDYGIERIFPSLAPSPRVRWRSTSTAQHTIALALDATLLGTVESALGNTAIGLSLHGINWRTGTWQGYDVDTTSWVTIASIDTATNLTALAWTRQGNTVIAAVAGSGNQPFLHLHECAGWTLGYNGVTFRKIKTNTEGRWDRTSATCKRPTLILEGVEAGDPSSGSSAYLMPTSYTVIVHTAAKYAGYRLVIDSQSTADGYFEIGAMVMGPVVFLDPYDWGRAIDISPGTELTRARDGTSRSRVWHPRRRTLAVAWQDGIDLSGVETGDPDYYLPTSTGGVAPAGVYRETPYTLDGLIGLLDGPHRHVVYLPSVAQGTPDTIHMNRRNQAIYGRITTPVGIETVVGEENSTELVRLASVEIEEEV